MLSKKSYLVNAWLVEPFDNWNLDISAALSKYNKYLAFDKW